MNIIPALLWLAAGLFAVYRIPIDRPGWKRRAMATVAILCLPLAGFKARDEVDLPWQRNAQQFAATRSTATERQRTATEIAATNSDPTQREKERYAIGPKRLSERDEKYAKVLAEIGPPPRADSLPVVGYVTASGAVYPSRWRSPPTPDKTDNLKQP